ncbi:MAG: polymorphic toxin type 50 domain-containing protein [Clostridia bacterium]
MARDNGERVDFKEIIGFYINKQKNKKYETTVGIIHYSKNGLHIVPARPSWMGR